MPHVLLLIDPRKTLWYPGDSIPVRQTLEANPSTNIRRMAHTLGLSRSTIHRILRQPFNLPGISNGPIKLLLSIPTQRLIQTDRLPIKSLKKRGSFRVFCNICLQNRSLNG